MDKCFIWKDKYNLNIKEIDDQHKNFVNILEEVYQSVLTNEDRKLVGKRLEDLKNYAIKHFATEEKYFDEFNYSDSKKHKAAHQDLEKRY